MHTTPHATGAKVVQAGGALAVAAPPLMGIFIVAARGVRLPASAGARS